MNRVVDSTDSPNEPIDRLLGAFFRKEMPAPWPAFRAPAKTRLAPEPSSRASLPAWTSRLALALALALLLAVTWLLPRTPPPGHESPPSLPTIGEGVAHPPGFFPGARSEKPGKLTPSR
jgi:hypothetical protein